MGFAGHFGTFDADPNLLSNEPDDSREPGASRQGDAVISTSQAENVTEHASREQALATCDDMPSALAEAPAHCDAAQTHEAIAALESELGELRAALSREQTAAIQVRAGRDQIQAAVERQRVETAHAHALVEQLKRERAQMQLHLDTVLLRVEESGAALRVAARQAALVGVVLERTERRVSRKGKRGRTLDELSIAKEQLARLQSNLETLTRAALPPAPAFGGSPGHDPNRILTGRKTRPTAAAALAQGIAPNGRHEHIAGVPLFGNGRADALFAPPTTLPVDIVICVHNALEDTKRCLASVVRNTPAPYHLIIVDDGSDAATAAYLQRFVREHLHATLLRNDHAVGYTKAANQGLRTAASDVVVLLNSDTIVTPRWLEYLRTCLESDARIGIVGPLSNAASYQSVPERFAPNGDWALNPVPPGWDIDDIAAAVARISTRAFPRVPFVNGFCFAVTRNVIEAIGYFDEKGFPEGYGEENDYCLRAADADFALAVADQAYVFHAKSRSYTHERRRALGKAGRATLVSAYGRERLEAGEVRLRDEPGLATTRSALADYLQMAKPDGGGSALSVLFLLPVGGGGGGAHSVVQEARGMRRLGYRAQVAIRAQHLDRYRTNYPDVDEREDLFFAYHYPEELRAHAAQFSVVAATIYSSIPLLAEIAADHPDVLPAYYIQDYEPFFYPEGSAGRADAARSYTRVPHAVLFAKTRWLCDTVGALHNVTVHKVSPSLDHEVYFPAAEPRRTGPVRVVAMIRPSSARRGADRTMKVLKRLATELGKQVEIHIFGCGDADLAAAGLPLRFPFHNHGVLTRDAVADTLRASDVFLDLSDYQAFGRTGLEAMACGCAVVLPALGGVSEYAVHGENALVVDTSNPDVCFEAAHALASHHDARQRLQAAGLAKAAEYSIDRAARTEIDLFTRELRGRSTDFVMGTHPATQRSGTTLTEVTGG